MADSTLAGPLRQVEVVDAPPARVRLPGDLLGLVFNILAIGVVLLLAAFAHSTTEGVTEDVQSAFARLLRQFIQLPLSLLQAAVVLLVPWIVVIERLVRRAFRQVVEAIAAGVLAALLAGLAVAALTALDSEPVTRGLSVVVDDEIVVGIPPFLTALAAFLTMAGTREQRRSVAWSWNLYWTALIIALITGELTVPGALVTVLLGRAVGLGVRYVVGVSSKRAYGLALVDGIRRAGIDAVRVVRVGELGEGVVPHQELVTTSAPLGHTEQVLELTGRRTAAAEEAGVAAGGSSAEEAGVAAGGSSAEEAAVGAGESPAEEVAVGASASSAPASRPAFAAGAWRAPEAALRPGAVSAPMDDVVPPDVVDTVEMAEGSLEAIGRAADPAARALERPGQGRVYAVTDSTGTRRDVVVLDGDRQVLGTLASAWAALRLRGLERRAVVNLRWAVERASLMTYAARAVDVRTPALVGVAEAEDSVVIAHEHLGDARRLADLAPAEITDALLADLWSQLRRAHAAGLAHRDLADDVVLVHAGQVWLVGWSNGEITSPELSRRVDIAQLLALLAMRVGVERAVGSAATVLDRGLLGAIAPLLQPVALPSETRALTRQRKAVLADLRAALVELIPPAADVEPVQLTRFSGRTVVTTTIAVVAVWLLLTSLNAEQLNESLQRANPWWAAFAFVVGMLPYIGAAMSLRAFSPVPLRLWQTTVVQVASSIVALVAPAGVGPAALNLRYLNRKKVDTPLAVASVALMQVSQFVTTVALLLVVAALTGSGSALRVPDAAVFVVMGLILAAVGVALAVPHVRQWAWAKAGPTIRQVWPRVLWVVGQPGRLMQGIVGNLIMTCGYIAAFAATLAAFGQEVPLTELAIIYLGGMALGSAVPTPGGLGTVELALSGGLAAAGVPPAVAASVAVLFRVLTFWGRVPLGMLAMRRLQRTKEL
jgi:uncharacterized membrane protein YbhN (UPF0104 family)